MRARTCSSLLVLSLLPALACRPAAPQFTAQDEAVLRAMFDSARTSIQAGNWSAWASQFSDSAVLQPPNGATVKGRAALEAWGHTLPSMESLTWPNVTVQGEGNLAYGTSEYDQQIKGLPADHGKQLVVFRRGAAGKWEVVAVSFSSDLPPAAPAPKQ